MPTRLHFHCHWQQLLHLQLLQLLGLSSRSGAATAELKVPQRMKVQSRSEGTAHGGFLSIACEHTIGPQHGLRPTDPVGWMAGLDLDAVDQAFPSLDEDIEKVFILDAKWVQMNGNTNHRR
jgi:hypothetical protein